MDDLVYHDKTAGEGMGMPLLKLRLAAGCSEVKYGYGLFIRVTGMIESLDGQIYCTYPIVFLLITLPRGRATRPALHSCWYISYDLYGIAIDRLLPKQMRFLSEISIFQNWEASQGFILGVSSLLFIFPHVYLHDIIFIEFLCKRNSCIAVTKILDLKVYLTILFH